MGGKDDDAMVYMDQITGFLFFIVRVGHGYAIACMLPGTARRHLFEEKRVYVHRRHAQHMLDKRAARMNMTRRPSLVGKLEGR